MQPEAKSMLNSDKSSNREHNIRYGAMESTISDRNIIATPYAMVLLCNGYIREFEL